MLLHLDNMLDVDSNPITHPKANIACSCALTSFHCPNLMQVGKLAKKLPVGNLKAMAAQLNSACGQPQAAAVDTTDVNEDDLT